jgi:mono/diheme cytochrome c family protein
VRAIIPLLVVICAVAACVGRPAETATGEEIYLQLCSNCHAEDLTGSVGPALGPGSSASAQPDEYLRMTITSGKGRMPSFESSLDEAQVERLIAYLREVQESE